MIAVDSSALIAMVLGEPEANQFEQTITESEIVLLSTANYVETSIVLDSLSDPVLSRLFDDLLKSWGVVVIPVSIEQAKIAREAYRDFGRGQKHPAKLNYGDCFAYALAREQGIPLLYKGDDFVHTDLKSALAEKP